MLKFYEAGLGHEKVVVLIHGWGCPWQIWQGYIDEMRHNFHVIVPSLAGYNEDGTHGKGIDRNARRITNYLLNRFESVHAIIGISYGANVTLKILAINKIPVSHAIADACYLPEHPNKRQASVMRFCAGLYRFARPFRKPLIKRSARMWGIENATMIVDKILSLPTQTLQDEIYSYFTFSLQENTKNINTDLHLWYGEKEKEKRENAAHVKQRFNCATTQVFAGCDHGEFMLGRKAQCLDQIYKIIGQGIARK